MRTKCLWLSFGIVQRSHGETAAMRSIYACGGRAIDARGIRRSRARPADHVAQWLLLPPGAPIWASDRAELWKRAGAAERRCDAQEARWLDLSIPREVPEQLYEEYANWIFEPFVATGLPVQVDLHSKIASDGERNPHFHATIGTRRLDPNGFARYKNDTRTWNEKFLRQGSGGIRYFIAQRANDFFSAKALPIRVDPRSNEERGLPVAEKTLPRAVVRRPDTDAARAAVAERDRLRSLRAEMRDATDSAVQLEAAVTNLARLAEEAEQHLIRVHARAPMPASAFRAACGEVASRQKRAVKPISATVCAIAIRGVDMIIHFDRVILEGTPDDSAINAIADFCVALFGDVHVEGPLIGTRRRVIDAVRGVSTSWLQADADLDAFPRPPEPPGRRRDVKLEEFFWRVREQEAQNQSLLQASMEQTRNLRGSENSQGREQGREMTPDDQSETSVEMRRNE